MVKNTDSLKLDPSLRYGKLDNGFTYYLRHNTEPAGEVYFQMVVKAGRFHEDTLQLEYAHLVEHLGAKGIFCFPELRKYIQNHGGNNNAGTADLFTYYWAKSSTENRELLKNSLRIIRGWAQGIDLDQTSIDVERGAVLGEIRTDNPYRDWISDTKRATVEYGSGYQGKDKREMIANIRHFNRDAFIRFYKEWYRPDLEAAIIVGDIDVDSLETEIKSLFSDLEMPKNPKDPGLAMLEHTIKLDGKNQFKVEVDTVNPKPRLSIFSKRPHPGYSPKTQEDFKNLLVQKVYQEILLTRMGTIKQYHPLFTLAPNHQYADRQLYTLEVSMNFNEHTPLKKKQAFLKSMAAFRSVNSGFTAKELKTAKEMVRKAYSEDVSGNTNKLLAEKYRNHFVLGTVALPPKQEKQMGNDLLDKINLSDVNRAATHYGDLRSNTDFIYYSGSDIETLDSMTIWSWLKELYSMEVEPFSPKPAITSLRDVVEVPNKYMDAVKNITENQIGVTTVELSNGVKLVLKPTANSNLIKIHASRPNNVPIRNRKKYIAATLAPRAIQFVGAASYTKFQLREFMGGVDLQLSQKLERTEQVITGKSRLDRLEDLLQVLYLYTQKPRMDEEAFEIWKSKEQSLIRLGNPNSNTFFDLAIEKLRFPALPIVSVKDIEALSMDEIYAAYHRWFGGFDGYTFVVTGGYDKEEILPVLIKYLSALPEGHSMKFKELKNTIIPLKKLNGKEYVTNKSEANVFLHFPVVYSTDPKSKVLVSLLGNALYSRIWDRLRKGSYSPGARVDLVDFKNGIYNFQIWFDAETGQEETLIQWALEEFRKLKEKGVDEAWFQKNLNQRISNYDMFFNSNRFWNNCLMEEVKSGQTMTSEILEYGTYLKHFVTLEDLNKAGKKLLSQRYLQKFIFLPKE